MSSHGCTVVRHRLAETESIVIERCACGTIHLNIGPLTLRLQAATLAELAYATRIAASDADEGARTHAPWTGDRLVS